MTKKILITGIAGFIGFHLALKLHSLGWTVIGIDNFNDYYDPDLKSARRSELKKFGIQTHLIDLINFPALEQLCKREKFTHVAHLAAQAGVRYCFEKSNVYMDANLKGFIHLLDACKHLNLTKLLYASSSSVYGQKPITPTQEISETSQPANLYGATKKANEVIAYSYHHAFSIPMIGLRYFTVYGPWGRPDMAIYKFTNQISKKQPIKLFNHGKMKRDFTFIDDAISGTILALEHSCDYEILNIGNSRPVGLFEVVHEIEHNLCEKAIIELMPLQPGESLETHADISKARKLLNYSPKVSLKEGITRFIEWYNIYSSDLSSLKAWGKKSIKSVAITE